MSNTDEAFTDEDSETDLEQSFENLSILEKGPTNIHENNIASDMSTVVNETPNEMQTSKNKTNDQMSVVVRDDRDSRANLMPIYGDLYQIKL